MKLSHYFKSFFCIIFTLASIFVVTSAHATDPYAQTTHGGEYPSYPVINYGVGEKAEQLKRGEYTTKLGDCIACHTAPHGGKPFAGGFPVETPFGTIYTPNITADKKTGLGHWSEADFIHAMQEGISPHGKYYYPAFPYLYFNIVTTQDLQD